MTFFARLIREPLVQFLVIGAAVFGVYALTADQSDVQRDRIVVSEGRIQQLAQVFAKTWQRPPIAQELRGLIDAYVKEEIYYREALKLGLDRDDTLIRRRMQQKMEFLSEPGEEALNPSDAELAAFYAENRDNFRIEPKLAFQQVFIDPKKGEEPAAIRAEQLLSELRSAPADAHVSNIGDATLLRHGTPLSSLTSIGNEFGEDFAKKLFILPLNQWSGPVESPFGMHLVRITERRDEQLPPLAQVRKDVERAWRTKKRDRFRHDEYERLRAKYEVVLPLKDVAAAEAEGGTQ